MNNDNNGYNFDLREARELPDEIVVLVYVPYDERVGT